MTHLLENWYVIPKLRYHQRTITAKDKRYFNRSVKLG